MIVRKYISILSVLALTLTASGQTKPDEGLNLRAKFVIDLIDEVEWPVESIADTGHEFIISVVGDSAIAARLQELAKEASTDTRRLSVKIVSSDADLIASQMIFIGSKELPVLAQTLKSIKKKPILTVSDSKGFAGYGVMVELISDSDKLEFAINKMALKEASLKMSEKLLGKAHKIYG
jgi:hypothetical protein